MENNPKELLDEALCAARDQEIEKPAIDAASVRAWDRISRELNLSPVSEVKIRGCLDVQRLLPEYTAGRLSEDHALLIRDHLAECVDCQINKSRRGTVLAWTAPAASTKPTVNHTRRYALAAALMVGAGVAGFLNRDLFLPAPTGYRATVQSIDGSLYALAPGAQRTLAVGQEIDEKQWVRTPRGAHAVLKLRDGSLVEMKENSEFGVSMNRRDTTVHLERGNVIVQAAHRRTGHLYVDTGDCFVSVTGTVFAVDRGTKGSRVSVIEGEVKVQRGGTQDILHSGDQVVTGGSMSPVPVKDEIAWSANLDQHLALLKEFSTLAKSLGTVRLPGLRYESRLLKAVPDDTVLFASIPNFGQALSDANGMFLDRVQQSPVLRDWWQKNSGADLSTLIERTRLFSSYLGDEVVLAASPDGAGGIRLMVLAEAAKPGLREFIEAQLSSYKNSPMRLVTASELAATHSGNGEMRILLDNNVVAISHDTQMLRSLPGSIPNTPPSANPYLQRVASAYRDGAGLLFTADLERIAAIGPRRLQTPTGADTLKYLVFEQKEIAGKTENRAVLSFHGARQGMASWLAAPAPMGSLRFISSDATLAASFVVKNPSLLLDDLIQMASANNPNFQQEFDALQSRLGIRFREDLASTFGSDITVSLDGPPLPTPSWKVSVEVNDPVRLQQTVERLIGDINIEAKAHGKQGIDVAANQVNGRTVYVVKFLDKPGFEPAYSFVDGYLIVAMSSPLVNRAVSTRDNGMSLDRSGRFEALLPADGQTNFSAMVYSNLSKFGDAASGIAGATAALSPGQKTAIQTLADGMKPTLIYAYGQTDQIQIATTGSLFGLGVDNVLSAGGLNAIFHNRLPGTSAGKTAYK